MDSANRISELESALRWAILTIENRTGLSHRVDLVTMDERDNLNITKLKVLMSGFGAMVAGLGGALYAHYALFIDSNNFGFHRSIEMVIFAIFGGVTSIWGPPIGAAILTVFPEVLRFIQEWRMVFYGLLMILMMTFRPQGLVTKHMFKDVLSRRGRQEVGDPA